MHIGGFYNMPGLKPRVCELVAGARAAGATTSVSVQDDATGKWDGLDWPVEEDDGTGEEDDAKEGEAAREAMIEAADAPRAAAGLVLWPRLLCAGLAPVGLR